MPKSWLPVGYRVTWLQSPAFAGHQPQRHTETVATAEEAMALVREVVRRKPVTQRGTYAPEVVEIQERTERREVPVGLGRWGR